MSFAFLKISIIFVVYRVLCKGLLSLNNLISPPTNQTKPFVWVVGINNEKISNPNFSKNSYNLKYFK